jgi:hypothetical protein
MKRFRRWVFNGLAAVLLLLFVATVFTWARSYWVADQFIFEGNHVAGKQEKMTFAVLWSTRAGLEVGFMKGVGRANPSADILLFHHFRDPPFQMQWMIEKTFLQRHGFRFSWGGSDNGYVNGVIAAWSLGFSLSVPYWFLLIGLPIHPAWRIFSRGKRGKGDETKCGVCGYDLRATPDRCPECGTIPSAP